MRLLCPDLPPMREFGILTAAAFALAIVADFTALPAALWVVFRERPQARCSRNRGPALTGRPRVIALNHRVHVDAAR